jgi:hypothetical protein
MLVYEYRVRDAFDRFRNYALRLRQMFDAGRDPDELLGDAENLRELYANLREILPKEVRDTSNLGRHLSFMTDFLRKGQPSRCRQDVEEILNLDLPNLESAFREWCKSLVHYDEELAEKIGDLLVRAEYDSAVRKAFVILRARLKAGFGIHEELDGADLVNRIFGRSGHPSLLLGEPERQAYRDLLSGLYGVFRNRYAHRDDGGSWYEADAVLSMVNCVLKQLDSLVGARAETV